MEENKTNDNLNLSEPVLEDDNHAIMAFHNVMFNNTNLKLNEEINNFSIYDINVDDISVETFSIMNVNKDVMNLDNGNAIVPQPLITRE